MLAVQPGLASGQGPGLVPDTAPNEPSPPKRRTCTPTPRSAAVLPDFDLQCTLSKDDAYATFDMIAGAPNALLGQGVLSLVVPVNGEAPANYTSVAVTGASFTSFPST